MSGMSAQNFSENGLPVFFLEPEVSKTQAVFWQNGNFFGQKEFRAE